MAHTQLHSRSERCSARRCRGDMSLGVPTALGGLPALMIPPSPARGAALGRA